MAETIISATSCAQRAAHCDAVWSTAAEFEGSLGRLESIGYVIDMLVQEVGDWTRDIASPPAGLMGSLATMSTFLHIETATTKGHVDRLYATAKAMRGDA